AKTELSGWQLVRRLLRYVWPKGNRAIKSRVLVALCLLLANVSVPFLYRDIVNCYNEKAPTFIQLTFDTVPNAIFTVGVCIIIACMFSIYPFFSMQIYDICLIKSDILSSSEAFSDGLARASSALMNELRNAVFAKVAHHSVRSIARNIFLHLHSLDLSFHLNRQTGALSKAIDRGTRGMSFVLSSLVFNIVPTAVEIGMVSAIFCGTLGSEFAYMTMGSIGMYTIATLGITRWRTKFRHEMNQADNDAGNKAVDSLINYETVKYFNNEKFEADRYDFYLKKFEHASLKTTSSLALLNFTQNAIFSAGLIGVMYLAANKIATGEATVGDLVLFIREVRQGLVDMNAMFSLLNLKSQIKEKPNAKQLVVQGNDISHSDKRCSFWILTGKTNSQWSHHGNPGRQKGRSSWWFWLRDSVLFHDTIFYNLAYGNPNASQEDVFKAARLADLHHSVESMPNGYNTIVGERGLKLSGGEKQRVAIARAILKATSSLDAITEANIMRSLKDAVQKRTSLFIAHRLATIFDADIIYVLDQGQVKEFGSHDELMRRGGLYAQLWNSQHRLGIPVPPKEPQKHDHLETL
ncbi:ABC transporter transmembrane region, partial [Ostertagia ostertagi]